jgi:AmmeMemoRadiSam system protein B
MPLRPPAVAGRFYQATQEDCIEQIEQMLPEPQRLEDLPEKIIAGIVPHAGWTFSGDLAAHLFAAIAAREEVETFIIFGAIHVLHTDTSLIYDVGQWQTPMGNIAIDETLAEEIKLQAGPLLKADCQAHTREHSIEVQVPIIQYLFEQIKIIPIMVPPNDKAAELGVAIAQAITRTHKKAICIGSTDLTHYGPSYGLTHMGTGADANQWAKETNDQNFIDLMLSMQIDQLVPAAQMYQNACGAGAVAATLAAAKTLGANTGTLLDHTTSAEVMQKKYQQSTDDSVGYAALIAT